jgi:hypothetical protein
MIATIASNFGFDGRVRVSPRVECALWAAQNDYPFDTSAAAIREYCARARAELAQIRAANMGSAQTAEQMRDAIKAARAALERVERNMSREPTHVLAAFSVGLTLGAELL